MSAGIRCPSCSSRLSRVSKTTTRFLNWRGVRKTMVRRRRVCRHCGAAWTTLETHEEDFTEEDLEQQMKTKPPTIPHRPSSKDI